MYLSVGLSTSKPELSIRFLHLVAFLVFFLRLIRVFRRHNWDFPSEDISRVNRRLMLFIIFVSLLLARDFRVRDNYWGLPLAGCV